MRCTISSGMYWPGEHCCRQNPGATSREMSRCSSREGLNTANARLLESPSLLRRVIAAGGSGLTDLDTPPASPTPFSYNSRSEKRV